MLNYIVFMSQMNRPCFSHSKTHVGKYNPRSVAKVIVISTKLSFFLDTLYFYQQVGQMFDGVLAIRKNYKPLFLHILSETQWMSCRVTRGEAFEQLLAPDLRKGVESDQSEEKGCKHTDDKYRH